MDPLGDRKFGHIALACDDVIFRTHSRIHLQLQLPWESVIDLSGSQLTLNAPPPLPRPRSTRPAPLWRRVDSLFSAPRATGTWPSLKPPMVSRSSSCRLVGALSRQRNRGSQ